MQVLRTIAWVLLAVAVTGFWLMNDTMTRVRFWPISNPHVADYFGFDWSVGTIGIMFFLLGFLPMWLVYRGQKWRLQRRISQLQDSQRATANAIATPAAVPPPAALAPEPVAGAPVPRDDILG